MQSNPFILKLQDILAFRYYYNFSNKKVLFFSYISVFILMLTISYYCDDTKNLFLSLICALIFTIFAFFVGTFFILIISPCITYFIGRKNGRFTSNCLLFIDQEKVFTNDKNAEISYKWAGIGSIVETKSHIFICFHKCNAFVVPKRAFDSNEAAHNFYERAYEYWTAAKAADKNTKPLN